MKAGVIGIIIAVILIVGIIGFNTLKPVAKEIPSPITSPTTSPTNVANNPGASLGEEKNIDIKGFSFSPATRTIKKGETITWTNQDSAAHTVSSISGTELNSGTLSNGQTYSHTFNTAGTFEYRCNFHTSMKGTIIVE